MSIKLINRADSDVIMYEIGHEDRNNDYSEAGVNVASVTVSDWNAELSPWKAEKCFKDGEDFKGEADAFLNCMIETIPAFEADNGINAARRGIMGYSLAGLFCLYAASKTDMFDMAASVSGSLWFDGWIDYLKARSEAYHDMKIYLSVGDREKKTRNVRLASVESNMLATRDILAASGADVICELNEGGHFVKDNTRMLRALKRLCL